MVGISFCNFCNSSVKVNVGVSFNVFCTFSKSLRNPIITSFIRSLCFTKKSSLSSKGKSRRRFSNALIAICKSLTLFALLENSINSSNPVAVSFNVFKSSFVSSMLVLKLFIFLFVILSSLDNC